MTNKILIGLIFFALVLGCKFTGETDSEKAPPIEATDTKKSSSDEIKLGDTVVARWSGNSFYEGKVQFIDGNKMTIGWDDGSKPTDIDKSDIYALPKSDSKPDVAVGDMVLAKIGTSTYWNGAQISAIDEEYFKIKAIGSSKETNVDSNKIIKVSAATAANLKEKAGATDFLKEASVKKPVSPGNFKPKKGDKVLAEWSRASWWTGKVNSVSGKNVTIAWDDGSKPSAVDIEKIIPHPTKEITTMPSDGQLVLAKPTSGTRWVYAKTIGIKDGEIEIEESNGTKRTVKSGEFVVLK